MSVQGFWVLNPCRGLKTLPLQGREGFKTHFVLGLHPVANDARLSPMTMTENILAVLDRATDDDILQGRFWYSAANALAWELDPARPYNGAGVIAALSPRLHWNKNVAYARIAYNLKGYAIPEVENYIPTLGNSRIKALKMVNGVHVSTVLGKGPKTNAFWHNILNPFTSERVTVDKHAANIARGEYTKYNDTVITNREYREIEAAYVEAGHISNFAPLQVQAITWLVWRRG